MRCRRRRCQCWVLVCFRDTYVLGFGITREGGCLAGLKVNAPLAAGICREEEYAAREPKPRHSGVREQPEVVVR